MGSEKALMSQKEYLKKYLSKDKVKKKKKKSKISSSSHIKRSVIIDDDDDLGLKDVATVDDEEFNLDYLGDEAPQIAGIVDERPAELKAKEKYQTNLWRPIGQESITNNSEDLLKIDSASNSIRKNDSDDSDHSVERPKKILKEENMTDRSRYRSTDNEHSDLSPDRTGRRNRSDSDISPPRISNSRVKHSNKSEKTGSSRSSEQSKSYDSFKYNKHHYNNRQSKGKQRLNENSDSDYPSNDHRYRKHYESRRNEEREQIKKREEEYRHNKDKRCGNSTSFDKYKGSNLSPDKKKGRNRRNSDSDVSPDRKKTKNKRNSDSDMSPDRKKTKNKRNSDSDMSPDRKKTINKRNSDSDISPDRKKSKNKRNSDSDMSPDRKNRRNSDSDMSPPRSSRSTNRYPKENRKLFESRDRINRDKDYHRKYDYKPESSSNKSRFKDNSPVNFKRSQYKDTDSDLSPERNHSSKKKRKDELNSNDNTKEKMLDGKKSGLQDAKHLKEELKRLRETEDQLFKKMDPKLLGACAAPIKRDRKTGQVRDIEKEVKEDKAKAEKKAKTEEKYYRWGKGLKQLQEQEDRVADAIHEMSKPLARYRDDKDLDSFLKAQEREGDPMLDYIRSKQSESHSVIDLTAGSSKPKYNGSFMPNRFGISPGYRWDGVDRSNGYEKKWFEQRNARKAVEEEAYKWSTSDM